MDAFLDCAQKTDGHALFVDCERGIPVRDRNSESTSGMQGMSRYAEYISDVSKDVAACIQHMACQPIVFIGSGLSRRYFSSPNWDELLEYLSHRCPVIDKEYAYYKQTVPNSIDIGEIFADAYLNWAWSSGKSEFPTELFSPSASRQIYIKHFVADFFKNHTPKNLDEIHDGNLKAEIALLQQIRPHAVITTNYDQLLELIFPEYTPIIGQKIINSSTISFGEIFKIHGCVSQADSIVLTRSDYDEFTRKKKYLSAKLLTYFSEHPLIFIGYSAGDSNICSILSDIDEALPQAGGVIPNVYILEWRENISSNEYAAREKLVPIEPPRSIRLKGIEATDFSWVFKAFSSPEALGGISPKILRALLARSYELVRRDIPRRKIDADFKMLENAVGSSESFAQLFGITTISDPSIISAKYPYTLTAVGAKLGYRGWSAADKLIARIKDETGFNIKASDNRYHVKNKYSMNEYRKYSDEAVNLLTLVRDGKPYEVKR